MPAPALAGMLLAPCAGSGREWHAPGEGAGVDAVTKWGSGGTNEGTVRDGDGGDDEAEGERRMEEASCDEMAEITLRL